MPDPGDVVILDFPGATGSKRRPAVVLSSDAYHTQRPDCIVGLITTQIAHANTAMDYILQDWQAAGLRSPSAFRAYLATAFQANARRIGRVSTRDWQQIQERVNRALA